jgi:hypothetical protein
MTRIDSKHARPSLPTGGYGCTMPLAGIGGVCIALGALAISHWDDLHTIVRVLAIVVIVFGAVCLIPMIGLWTLRRWVRRFTANLSVRIKEVNASVVRDSQEFYDGGFEYRPATEKDFEGLNRGFYERTFSDLNDAGCRHLGDIVNMTLERAKNVHSVIRLMVSADGKSSIIICHATVDDLSDATPNRPILAIDIDSEFLDDTFLCTSNSPSMSLKTLPAQLRMDLCPSDTPPVEMLHRHETELAKLKSSDPLIFNTLAEAVASLQRKRHLTANFRKLIGDANPANLLS